MLVVVRGRVSRCAQRVEPRDLELRFLDGLTLVRERGFRGDAIALPPDEIRLRRLELDFRAGAIRRQLRFRDPIAVTALLCEVEL